MSNRIIRQFKPDIAIGVGGFASGPLLKAASRKGIPCLLQEQNGFAGLTNKLLAKKAAVICVAYEGMERFFPAEKIVITGNPIRSEMHSYTDEENSQGIEYYGFSKDKKHILVIGGSLGSGTLNKAMKKWIEDGCQGGENIEILWQCGKYYKADIDSFMANHNCPNIKYTDFISRMDLAYAMADVLISRSGASSISEICACGKAAVFVPSPNVAEDHQTHNAMALVRKGAAEIVKDEDALNDLLPKTLALLADEARLNSIRCNAAAMALLDSATKIAEEVYRHCDPKV